MARYRPFLLGYFTLLVLAWPTECAGLAPIRLPRPGRSLLQLAQIPADCYNGFLRAYAVCVDLTAQTPGSLCCNGLQQLGADCLQAVQAALPSYDASFSALVSVTISSCQIALDGPTPPASNDACLSGYAAALSSCGGSGNDCCGPVRALGDACLSQLAASSDAFSSVTFGELDETCGLKASGGGDDEQLPDGTTNKPLPDGTIATSWSAMVAGGAVCPVWYEGEFHSGTQPTWNRTVTRYPPDAEILRFSNRWCENRDVAVPEMLQALDSGGRVAQAAVAANMLMTCPADNAALRNIMDLFNARELKDPRTTVKYMKAFAKAADQSGIDFCATVVVTSNLTGSVLFYKNYHVGPQADEPDGCLPNFQQAQVICSNDTAPPAQPCCDAVDELGSTCRATIAASPDPLVSSAYASIVAGCGPFADAPAPSPSVGGLPPGNITWAYVYGPTAQCYTFDASSQNFTLDRNSNWAAARDEDYPEYDSMDFASQICELGEDAGPLLVEAFTAGGDQAKAAYNALTHTGALYCSNITAKQAALSAFMEACMSDRDNLFSLINSLVDAADHVGPGICVTVVVRDPLSGALRFQAQVHTSVPVPGSPAPAPSRRRSLHGLDVGAAEHALGWGRNRVAQLRRAANRR